MSVTHGHTKRKKANPDAPPRERDPWRDERGRFLPGNPGGPGNPHVREMSQLRAHFRGMSPGMVFETIAAVLQSKALGGHYPSLKLYLEYMMGKPDKSIDFDDLYLHELEQAIKRARLERAAVEAGVALPLLAPLPEAPPEPPPAGRPEAQWRRVKKAKRKAEAPAGQCSTGPDELERVIQALAAAGEFEALRGLYRLLGHPVEDGPDAHGATATVSKRGQSGRAPKGGPPGPEAPERR